MSTTLHDLIINILNKFCSELRSNYGLMWPRTRSRTYRRQCQQDVHGTICTLLVYIHDARRVDIEGLLARGVEWRWIPKEEVTEGDRVHFIHIDKKPRTGTIVLDSKQGLSFDDDVKGSIQAAYTQVGAENHGNTTWLKNQKWGSQSLG